MLVISGLQIGVQEQEWVKLQLIEASAHAFDYHMSQPSHTESLLYNWSATGRGRGSGNVTGGLKFKSRTNIQSHTHTLLCQCVSSNNVFIMPQQRQINNLSVISSIQCHPMLPEMFEEIR